MRPNSEETESEADLPVDDGDAFEGPESGANRAPELKPLPAPRRRVEVAPVAAIHWPALRGPSDVIFETWGGFGAECSDCGFIFTRSTAEAAREAVTYKDEVHGKQACARLAAALSDKEREALRARHAPMPTVTTRTKNARPARKQVT